MDQNNDSLMPSTHDALYHDHNYAPQPPVPYADFQFSFDPPLHPLLPDPPPPVGLGSTELFSPNETSGLFGFLDEFNWEFDVANGEGAHHHQLNSAQSPHAMLPAHSLLNGGHEQMQQMHDDTLMYPPFLPAQSPQSPQILVPLGPPPPNALSQQPSASQLVQRTSARRPSVSTSTAGGLSSAASQASPNGSLKVPSRAKSLLSTPEKRMNHIMSEQKRRNAIREGYAQLTALLAPANAPPGMFGVPTRGRPKGSGARSKGRPTKGKSGVLLRAVEYCRWLEEGRDALRKEVERVELAAGIIEAS